MRTQPLSVLLIVIYIHLVCSEILVPDEQILEGESENEIGTVVVDDSLSDSEIPTTTATTTTALTLPTTTLFSTNTINTDTTGETSTSITTLSSDTNPTTIGSSSTISTTTTSARMRKTVELVQRIIKELRRSTQTLSSSELLLEKLQVIPSILKHRLSKSKITTTSTTSTTTSSAKSFDDSAIIKKFRTTTVRAHYRRKMKKQKPFKKCKGKKVSRKKDIEIEDAKKM